MKRIIAIVAVSIIGLTGCYAGAEPDERVLHYKAGPLTATKFEKCIEPGNRETIGVVDGVYSYRADQRTFDFTGVEGSERGPIEVADKGGVLLKVPGVLTFTLTSNCENLRTFHEQIGLKYGAWTDEGWLNALNTYLGNPVEKAVDQASQKYTWQQLYNDQSIRDAWEAEVGAFARRFAAEQAGYDWFCAPAATEEDCGDFELTIQKPLLPEALTVALSETAAEVERKNQATNAQARINVEAQSLQSLVDVLGVEGAIVYQAIKEGKLTTYPIPTGSSIIVDPR